MREIEIVERIRRLAGQGRRDKDILKAIGDDCAILRPRANEDLVFTSDFILEGRHFTLDTHTAADIGHKALARSLSDLAAMGAEPAFCMVSLAVPAERSSWWVTQFYKGLLALAERFNVTLAGGDLARFDSVVADVTCCGRTPREKALLRSGAKPGDRIYVTGELGGSAYGLAVQKGPAWRRHLRPEPRIEAGIALRRLGASACIDLSDGLSLDLHRVCVESRVSAEITSNLPVARGVTLDQALHGGEDYELLFTAPDGKRLPKQIGGVRAAAIGVIARGHPGEVRLDGRRLEAEGFEHFK
jgi:thiamine-monophosphate kinase